MLRRLTHLEYDYLDYHLQEAPPFYLIYMATTPKFLYNYPVSSEKIDKMNIPRKARQLNPLRLESRFLLDTRKISLLFYNSYHACFGTLSVT